MRDRIVQQACRIVIEPVFEANCQTQSYGFRPRRSAAQAVRAVDKVLLRGWWIVDADIQGYFDAIDHDLLITLPCHYNRRHGEKDILDGLHPARARGRCPTSFLVGLRRNHPYSFRRMVGRLPQRLVLGGGGMNERDGLLLRVAPYNHADGQ